MEEQEWQDIIRKAKTRLLRMHFESRTGHIGGNLSCLDTVAYLHMVVMQEDDTFILSKGHSSGALYTSLWLKGEIKDSELATYAQDGTLLTIHPQGFHAPAKYGTGSLGHGLSLAAGEALSRKLRKQPGTVYCLCSEGDMQEGQTWEAMAFIARERLRVVCLVDSNGWQGFGNATVIGKPWTHLPEMCSAMQISYRAGKGHGFYALGNLFGGDASPYIPRLINLKTVKGHGVSFMENNPDWHYMVMTEELYQMAAKEVTNAK